jgi:hypothetical protein
VAQGRCRNSTWFRPGPLPFKSFTIHYSLVTFLGVGPSFGAHDNISLLFYSAWQVLEYWNGASSLTRGRVCSLQCSHSLVRVARPITLLYCLIWDSPQTWGGGHLPVFMSPRNKVAQLYPPCTGLTGSALRLYIYIYNFYVIKKINKQSIAESQGTADNKLLILSSSHADLEEPERDNFILTSSQNWMTYGTLKTCVSLCVSGILWAGLRPWVTQTAGLCVITSLVSVMGITVKRRMRPWQEITLPKGILIGYRLTCVLSTQQICYIFFNLQCSWEPLDWGPVNITSLFNDQPYPPTCWYSSTNSHFWEADSHLLQCTKKN